MQNIWFSIIDFEDFQVTSFWNSEKQLLLNGERTIVFKLKINEPDCFICTFEIIHHLRHFKNKFEKVLSKVSSCFIPILDPIYQIIFMHQKFYHGPDHKNDRKGSFLYLWVSILLYKSVTSVKNIELTRQKLHYRNECVFYHHVFF